MWLLYYFIVNGTYESMQELPEAFCFSFDKLIGPHAGSVHAQILASIPYCSFNNFKPQPT